MPRRDDTSLASLLLSQRLVDVGAPPLKASEYWRVRHAVEDLAALLGAHVDDVEKQLEGDTALAERVVALLDGATAVAFELENLEQSGVSVISPVDDTYPRSLLERLRVGAPPILYVAGPAHLLSSPSLGIVGSRGVAIEGADVARGAARRAVSGGYAVVSGGAKGVDQLAMQAAFDADGQVVGVLAESLLRRLREPDTRSAVLEGRACLCTPFKPSAGFSVANAMGRNKVVYGLSEATLVVASDLKKGGTWAGAHEAIRNRTCDVVVWTGAGAGEGNGKLVAEGGRPITDLEELFPLEPVERETPDDARVDQLTLEI